MHLVAEIWVARFKPWGLGRITSEQLRVRCGAEKEDKTKRKLKLLYVVYGQFLTVYRPSLKYCYLTSRLFQKALLEESIVPVGK